MYVGDVRCAANEKKVRSLKKKMLWHDRSFVIYVRAEARRNVTSIFPPTRRFVRARQPTFSYRRRKMPKNETFSADFLLPDRISEKMPPLASGLRMRQACVLRCAFPGGTMNFVNKCSLSLYEYKAIRTMHVFHNKKTE